MFFCTSKTKYYRLNNLAFSKPNTSYQQHSKPCIQRGSWCLVNRGYKEDHVDSEIKRLKLVERTVLLRKQDKKIDDSITLILTYYVALNQLYEIL